MTMRNAFIAASGLLLLLGCGLCAHAQSTPAPAPTDSTPPKHQNPDLSGFGIGSNAGKGPNQTNGGSRRQGDVNTQSPASALPPPPPAMRPPPPAPKPVPLPQKPAPGPQNTGKSPPASNTSKTQPGVSPL